MSEAAPLLARRTPGTHRERVAAALDLDALSPRLRVLLTTDGTVTETLAALHGEEVGVRVLTQAMQAGDGGRAPLLVRTIALVGADSGRIYTLARSKIAPELLPRGLRDGLLAGREPVGKLMLEHRLETFREIATCGRCPAAKAPRLGPACAQGLEVAPDAPVVWRTYRVINGGRTIMIITEYFPEDDPAPGPGARA